MRDPIRREWLSLVSRVLCGLLVLQASEVPALAFVARQDGQGLPTVERMVDRTGDLLDQAGEGLADGWHRGVGSVRRGLHTALAQGTAGQDQAPAKATREAQSDQAGQAFQTGQSAPSADLSGLPLTDRLTERPAPAGASAARQTPQAPPGVSPRPPSLPRRFEAPSSNASSAGATLQPRLASLDAVPLLAGLNLVSLPKEPPDPSPETVLGPIAGQVAAVYAYDNCDPADPWKVYDPADPAGSNLTAVDHTDGLWIAATTSATLPIAGTQPLTTDIPLCTGWNLVGYPLAQERPVTTALASIMDRLVRVYGYDVTDPSDPWEVYDPAVPFWANDLTVMQPGRGYWVLVSDATVLQYSNQGPPPAVDLLAPADLAEVTAPSVVTGTVTSDLLQSWTLGYRPSGDPGPFTQIGAGTTPVTAATLGTFDPTLLLNGLYELRLQATDFAGQIVEDSITVAVDGQQKVGNFTLSFTDLDVPVSGLPIQVIRTYDSRDKRQGDFGVGWSLQIRQGSYTNNRTPGDGWQVATGFLPCQTVQETLSHLTSIRISDQEIYRFRLRLSSPAPSLGGCYARASFAFVDGPVPGATLGILGNTDVFWGNGTNEAIDIDSLEIYEPQDVRLTTPDGRIFDLDLAAGVTRLADPNGNALAITDTGITHSSGKSITFERDTAGRISRVVDPLGHAIDYSYDTAGDLASVTDREDNTTRFTYNATHGLLDIEDPRGITPIRNDYDDAGRLISHTDAFGKTITFDHDLDGRREVITDRLGHTRVLEYNALGKVTRDIDAEGNETLRTYDARGNLLSETDPHGNTTSYTYDASNNQTSITGPLGNTTTRTFNARGQVLVETDPRGGVTSRTYDAAGNLLSTTDPSGDSTTFTYDSRGNLLSTARSGGVSTTFAYNASGLLTSQTDPLGNTVTITNDAAGRRTAETTTRSLPGGGTESLTTTFTYDANGGLVATTDPEGATTRTVFDGVGSVIETIDPLGRSTSYDYDLLGRLTETTHPDGTKESRTYDFEGNLLSSTDRAGRTTRFEYDTQGRLIATVFPDGATTTTSYDTSGHVVGKTDARGNQTTFEYDAAGRQIKAIDALGQAMVFTYDASGNQETVTDPKGNTTTIEYDASNRPVRTVYPDGTEETVEYDSFGRRTARTDPAGNVTRFTYDAGGQLLTVTDALGQVTSFAYDELGNRVSQTDANGNTTSFAYDGVGREIARTLPDGSTEGKSYDLAGQLASRTDFAGRTTVFTYGLAGRLATKSLPGGGLVTFTYTATGQRATASDARGTTSYAYDARDRLTTLTYPDGRRLLYGYDPAGNRVSLTAEVGGETLTTTSTYDALNRLDTVTDPDGRSYVHGYDANGNRQSLDYPNGVTTTYAYDTLNRLTDLTTHDSGGVVLQSYAYTLGVAGNRTAVTEDDGTTRAYTYDALFRLTGELVTGGSGPVFTDAFTYDPVGNRLARDHTEAGGTTTTPSTYDTRDRLLTEGSLSYTWDANGNLTGKGGADGATYTWDGEDRLIRVETVAGDVVTHAYDADGNRVRTEVTPATGPPTVTEYLVDPSEGLSHVVAETDGSGALSAYYVRGDDLLAVVRPATGARFFHSDGLGSTRALTDEAGAVTDRYTFSAFGKLLDHQGSDPNAYLFAGESLDPNSGFYYLRARWMDPEGGRFVSIDPFAGLANEPITLHKYLYANADPIDATDPSGTESLISFSFAFQVIGILFSISGIISGIRNISEGQVAKGVVEIAFGFLGLGTVASTVGLLRFVASPLNLAIRARYIALAEEFAVQLPRLRAAGQSAEEIARGFVAARNAAKVAARARMISEGGLAGRVIVKVLELRNYLKYGDKIGPTAEYLLENKGTWEAVIESAMRTSQAINRFLGIV